MNILPLAERELRVASRRRGTYWVRFGFAAVAILIAGLVFLSTFRQSPMQQAQLLFGTLCSLAFVYCLVAGALATADCVSEEKREGTLGLLFLTSLRGYDVVTGKILASSLRAVSGLAALLPVIVVPLLMGAVGGREVRNVALALGNTMFLSLTLGVLVSVLVRDSRHAVGGAIAGVAALLGLLPLARWLFIEYVLIDMLHAIDRNSAQVLEWTLYPNPVMLLVWGGEGFTAMGTSAKFWTALAVQHAMGWGFLLAACALAPRTWQDRTEKHASRNRAKSTEGTVESATGSGDRVRGGGMAERAAVLERHPFGWLLTRDRRGQWFTWAGLGVVGGVWLWGYLEVKEDWLQAVVGLTTLVVAGAWLKVRAATAACRHLHEHRRSGALELVLCTAQTPETVLRGHLDGLLRIFLSPLATVVALGGLLMVAAAGQDRGASDVGDLVLTFVTGAGVLLLDLWTIAWAGMWYGMRSSRYVRAWALTLGQVLLLPWALFILGTIVVSIAVEMLDVAPAFDPGFRGMLTGWLAITVAVDGVLLVTSRDNLRRRFRDLAVEHYGPAVPVAVSVAVGAGKPSSSG